jgi:hypothetical protein
MEIDRNGWRVFYPVYEKGDEDTPDLIDVRPFQELEPTLLGMYCIGVKGDQDVWVYETIQKSELRECQRVSKTIF